MPSASSEASSSIDDDDGGYTYQFVDTPEERLNCILCQHVSRKPQLSLCCGRTYCKSCLGKWKRTSRACPYACRCKLMKTVAHPEAERTILGLRVYCSNGCPWTGPLIELDKHLASASCDASHTGHSYMSCPTCGQTGIWHSAMADHMRECPRVAVKCPLCGVNIDRGDLNQHNIDNVGYHLKLAINSLRPSMIICHLIILMILLGVLVISVMISANTDNLVKAITSVHNDFHTNLASLDQRYQEDLAMTRDQINMIKQTLEINISRQVDVKMDELIKSLQAKVEVDISSVCELPKYNINQIRHQLESLKDKVKHKELSQAVRWRMLADDILHQTRLIESKISSDVPLLIEQCQEDVEEMQRQIEEVLERLDFAETLNATRNSSNMTTAKVSDEVTTSQSLLQPDDSERLSFVEVNNDMTTHSSDSDASWSQTLYQLSTLDSQVTPVILKMSNFSEKMKKKEEWYSKPFFAFKGGYKLLLKTKNKLSVSLHLMKGPYDDELEQSGHWPLRGTFTIELLNQLNDVKHTKKDFRMEQNISYQGATLVGLTEFDKSLMTNSDYIINDNLFFRVDYDCVC